MFHILTKQVQKPFLRPVSGSFGVFVLHVGFHSQAPAPVTKGGCGDPGRCSSQPLSEILILVLFAVMRGDKAL